MSKQERVFHCSGFDDFPALRRFLRRTPNFNVGVERGTRHRPVVGLGLDHFPERDGSHWFAAGEIVCANRALRSPVLDAVSCEIVNRQTDQGA